MKAYQVVWSFLLTYMGYKAILSATGKGTFLGTSLDYLYDDMDSRGLLMDSKNNTARIKNSYLVLIGTETNKYSFYYQPDTVIISFGGYRRDIFEKTLLRLNFDSIFTVVSNDMMKGKIQNDIRAKNVSDQWFIVPSVGKKATNLKGEIRRVFSKIQSIIPFSSLSDATIIFDIGDFSASFLKTLIHLQFKSCSQFIIYNRKQAMVNLKSIQLMMQRAGYRYVSKAKSPYIATFVSKKSALWK